MYRKEKVCIGFSTIQDFRHSLEVWNIYSVDKGGATLPCFTLKASFVWFLEPHVRLLPKMFSDLP